MNWKVETKLTNSRKRSIKGKAFGDRDLLERFTEDLEEHFFTIVSHVKPSDQGGDHILFTVFFFEEDQ